MYQMTQQDREKMSMMLNSGDNSLIDLVGIMLGELVEDYNELWNEWSTMAVFRDFLGVGMCLKLEDMYVYNFISRGEFMRAGAYRALSIAERALLERTRNYGQRH